MDFHEMYKKIEIVAMDVDGVLTDGKIILGDGVELKSFHVQDGYAIKKLHDVGKLTVIITGRSSKCVSARAKELGIKEVHQGVKNKLLCLDSIREKYGLEWDEVCYIGDDDPDLEVMKKSGLKIAVNNATTEIKRIADYVSEKDGGNGAIREILDLIFFQNRD